MRLIFFLYFCCFLSLSHLSQTENSFTQQTIKTINLHSDRFDFNLEIEEQLEPVNSGTTHLVLTIGSPSLTNEIVLFPVQRNLKDSLLSYYSLFTNSPPSFFLI
ncbi:hypothetical protein K2X05_07675 [bacterium]|nr:hypothetical protein [bacterium]